MNRFREPVNGFTHLAGALLSLVALIWLIMATWQDPVKMLVVAIYGVSLTLLFSASAALHLTQGTPRLLLQLERFDHAAIYVLIAGTYTPFCYKLLDGGWRIGMLALVWGLATVGVLYTAFFHHHSTHLTTLLYVAMGWIAVLVAPQVLSRIPLGALILLVAGGFNYSLGAVVYARKQPNLHRHFGSHELWHLFVLGGSALHFWAIARYVVM
jgi:hemolysin III